jgi:hypothetical protein
VVYFIAEAVLKLTVVARFKLYHDLTVTCSEIGNKTYRCPLQAISSDTIQLTIGRQNEQDL